MTQSCQALHVILGAQHCPVFSRSHFLVFIEVVFTQVPNQNNFAMQYRDIGTSQCLLEPRSCSPEAAHRACLCSQPVFWAAALCIQCKTYSWLSWPHIWITKDVLLPCSDYSSFPANLPNSGFRICNLQAHSLQSAWSCSGGPGFNISKLLLHIISCSFTGRCSAPWDADARAKAGSRLTERLELGLSSCSRLPLQPGDDADPLTILLLWEAAFLTPANCP